MRESKNLSLNNTGDHIYITIRSFAQVRELLGSNKINLEVNQDITITKVLEQLILEYPKIKNQIYSKNTLDENYMIALNKVHVDHRRLNETKVHEGDEIAILPPAGGG